VARECFGLDEGMLMEITRTALEGAFADHELIGALLDRMP
jgi:hypothetical protein